MLPELLYSAYNCFLLLKIIQITVTDYPEPPMLPLQCGNPNDLISYAVAGSSYSHSQEFSDLHRIQISNS